MRSSVMRLVALLAALGAVLPSTSQAEGDAYQRFLNAAVRLHENLEYERALEQMLNARRSATTPDQQAEVCLYEGILLTDLNRSEEARVAFKEGLLLKPDAQLPLKVAPRVQAEFERLRAAAQKELAPLLARQEAERRRAETELRAKSDVRTLQLRAAEEEALRAQEQARSDAERARKEAEVATARRAAPTPPPPPPADTPLRASTVAAPVEATPALDARLPPPPPPLAVRRPPVAAIVFLSLAAVAAGAAVLMGSQVEKQVEAARVEPFQDTAAAKLADAKSTASMANLLFGTTGAMSLGALISGIVWVATPATRGDSFTSSTSSTP
jgi:hypothetical protein